MQNEKWRISLYLKDLQPFFHPQVLKTGFYHTCTKNTNQDRYGQTAAFVLLLSHGDNVPAHIRFYPPILSNFLKII